MCGIAGVVGGAPSREALERMASSLAHRGPDDSGVHLARGAGLAHRRLSVLDPTEAGRQPMSLGPLTIVFNGEIYNFPELRKELPGPFRSNSDTEVLLHLYARDGTEMVHTLRGMFAFAIWDEEHQRLFAARDRIGIKPLFYRATPDGVAFGSELKALLELGRPSVERTALWDYLTYAYVPFPKTVYQGISRLPPAHTLIWDGRLRVQRYWSPDATTRITSQDEALDALDQVLAQAVPEHTLSDVPLGLLLSGGVDSSCIASYLDHPHTFTLGMDVDGYDERDAARSVAEHLGTRHHEALATAADLGKALTTLPRLYDEPFADSAAWSAFLVSRMAREHVKVVLTGDGGDELFFGYSIFAKGIGPRRSVLYRIASRLLPPFSSGSCSMAWRGTADPERYGSFLAPFTSLQKRSLFSPDLTESGYDDYWHHRAFWREDLDPLQRRRWLNLHTDLPGRLLTKVDRASMAHGLEARPPLLDHRLVELALSMDPALHRNEDQGGKLVLRRLMEPRLPAGHLDRPKRGFDLPIREWQSDQRGALDGAVARLAREGLLRRAARPRLDGLQIWALLSLDAWVSHIGGVS